MKKLLLSAAFLLGLGFAAPAYALDPNTCTSLPNGFIRDGVTSCSSVMAVTPVGGQLTSPAPAPSGKLTQTDVTLAAITNTTLVAANANRLNLEIQCSAATKVSRTGATLTSAAQGSGPAGTVLGVAVIMVDQSPSLTAYTGYSTAGGTCTITEVSR